MSSLSGKNALVTGASSGIGAVIAQAIAAAGAHVIAVGRDAEKTSGVVDRIRTATGNPNVEAFVCDLSTLEERRQLIEAVRGRCDRLDVLVNNAGQVNRRRTLTTDGLEATFALNHLATFQITVGLLGLLQKTGTARVVVTASNAHVGCRLDLNDLQMENSYSGWKAYQRSKLANILFTYEAARRWAGTGVAINAFHPGAVGTGIVREFPWPITAVWKMVSKTPEVGARGGIRLALAPELAGVSGKYFAGTKAATSSPESRDETTARALWERSEALIGM